MRFVEPSRGFIIWSGFILLVAYSAWIGGPYLRSVVVRDAALTTWVHIAAAPSEGQVADTPIRPGDRIGADDRILSIDNRGSDSTTLKQARANLDRARARLSIAQRRDQAAARRSAQEDLDEAFRLFDARRGAVVQGPPRAVVLSVSATHGTAVQPGMSVATFADCRVMLVDAPVADAVLSLLYLGSQAMVVLEGERRERAGRIMPTRNSKTLLGPNVLAAIPKGRRPGLGQVVVTLDEPLDDPNACPIGHAAFVRFPDVNGLAVLRSRLH